MNAARMLACAAAIAASVAPVVSAQPTVIHDARLDALRVTAAVGRGYGMATNQIYGGCLTGVRDAADTSYDLDFQLLGLHTSEDIDGLDRDGQKFVRTYLEHAPGENQRLQAMVAVMAVQARVRPLDESEQKLVDGPSELLNQGRLSAFISVCGTHYVRAIRRRSSLYVLFTYEAPAADDRFERGFRTALSGFALAAPSNGDSAVSSAAAAFHADAAQRNLRIVEWAIGLNAQPGGGIAFDMASYRKLVDQAFQASQHDRAGIPYEIEVVPWVSHPAVVNKILLASGRSEADVYALREIIGESSDYYLELVARVADARARATTVARCQDQLYRTYLHDGQLRPMFATAYLKSERLGSSRVLPLTALVAALTPAAAAVVEEQAEAYALDLDADAQPRAAVARCLAQLERAELKVRHQTIPECAAIGAPFSGAALATLALVDGYCFPELAPALPPTRAGG